MRSVASAKKTADGGEKNTLLNDSNNLTKVVFLVKGKITSLRPFYLPPSTPWTEGRILFPGSARGLPVGWAARSMGRPQGKPVKGEIVEKGL
jgi:hypothetical protein